jgi:hypothetical protein
MIDATIAIATSTASATNGSDSIRTLRRAQDVQGHASVSTSTLSMRTSAGVDELAT